MTVFEVIKDCPFDLEIRAVQLRAAVRNLDELAGRAFREGDSEAGEVITARAKAVKHVADLLDQLWKAYSDEEGQ